MANTDRFSLIPHLNTPTTTTDQPLLKMSAPTTYNTVAKFDWKKAATDPEHFSSLADGPAFILYDSAFGDVLGSAPSLTLVESRSDKFAHEAGVYIAKTDRNYFTSNYQSGKSVEIYSVDSKEHKIVQHSFPSVKNGNGGCWYRDQVLFCAQGDLTSPSALVLVDPSTSSSETLLNNFHGRPFNSLNDVVVHHANDDLWFTGELVVEYALYIGPIPGRVTDSGQTQHTATNKPSASHLSYQVRSTATNHRQGRFGALRTASRSATDCASALTTRKCTSRTPARYKHTARLAMEAISLTTHVCRALFTSTTL
jgi:hypothetical protein